MTEDEARTKLCHVTLRATLHGGPAHGAFCRASDCMAWCESWRDGDDGFCGLAGGANAVFGSPPGTVVPPTEPTPS